MIQVSNIEWEDSNLLRKYPVAEESTCVDDAGTRLDTGVIQDLSIVTYTALVNPRIGSVYIGKSIVSVTIMDDLGPVAVFTEAGDVSGKSISPTQSRRGVFARITLGETKNPTNLRFSDVRQSGIHEFCIVDASSSCVTAFIDDTSGKEFSGDMELVFRAGIKCDIKNNNTIDPTVVLSAADSLEKTLSSGCVPTDLNKSCVAPVIQTINGVKPNEFGEIAIVFE